METHVRLSSSVRTEGCRAQTLDEGRTVWVAFGGYCTYHLYSSRPDPKNRQRSYLGYVSRELFNSKIKEETMDTLDIPNKFYMVVRHPQDMSGVSKGNHQNPRIPSDKAPRSLYFDRDKAEEAATDLAMRVGKKFVVLEASASFEVEKPVVKKTL